MGCCDRKARALRFMIIAVGCASKLCLAVVVPHGNSRSRSPSGNLVPELFSLSTVRNNAGIQDIQVVVVTFSLVPISPWSTPSCPSRRSTSTVFALTLYSCMRSWMFAKTSTFGYSDKIQTKNVRPKSAQARWQGERQPSSTHITMQICQG